MSCKRFNPKKLDKLNNPDRLLDLPPEQIWSLIGLEKADVIVDIGAGTGFLTVPFASYANKIFACDISDTMITWITENICQIHPKIIPLKMDDNSVPLKDGVADLVFMMNLHHELDDSCAMLGECTRLLKSGGKILIIDWKKEDMVQGPPKDIRCLPQDILKDMEAIGLHNILIDESLNKHFLMVGEK